MDIRDIQNALNTHGFPCGGADGSLGPNTKAAVGRFQAAYCGPGGWLDIDGLPGPKTQAALDWTVKNNALVTHFSIGEIACRHCGRAYVKRELLSAMFKLRETVGPVVVASAYRCEVHNSQIGGAPYSQHLLGLGFDPTNVTIAQVLPLRAFTGIGTPDRRRATHLDLRAGSFTNPTIFYDASNK